MGYYLTHDTLVGWQWLTTIQEALALTVIVIAYTWTFDLNPFYTCPHLVEPDVAEGCPDCQHCHMPARLGTCVANIEVPLWNHVPYCHAADGHVTSCDTTI